MPNLIEFQLRSAFDERDQQLRLPNGPVLYGSCFFRCAASRHLCTAVCYGAHLWMPHAWSIAEMARVIHAIARTLAASSAGRARQALIGNIKFITYIALLRCILSTDSLATWWDLNRTAWTCMQCAFCACATTATQCYCAPWCVWFKG
eukprot:4912986-Amphidinium_carterae.1